MDDFAEWAARREAEARQRCDAASRGLLAALDDRYSVRFAVRLKKVVAKLERNVGKFFSRVRTGDCHDR